MTPTIIVIIIILVSTILIRSRLIRLAHDNGLAGTFDFGKKKKRKKEEKIQEEIAAVNSEQLRRQQSFAFKFYVFTMILGLIFILAAIYVFTQQDGNNLDYIITGLAGIGEIGISAEAKNLYNKATDALK